MSFVRTLRGDIAPGELGLTNYHEHLFQVSPLLAGEELDDEAASSAEAATLLPHGVKTFVDATPIGLGRRPLAAAQISADLDLHVVHTTGVHKEEHYPARADLLGLSADALTSLFLRELREGMVDDADFSGSPQTLQGGPRAGLIKIGIGYWATTDFEKRAIEAAGRASAATGAPVMVHLEHGSAAHEVLDALGQWGCAEHRVALAHIDRNPDPELHLELAERGAYLGYDGPARHKSWPDNVLIDCLARVFAGGGGSNTLLGGDVARRSRYLSYGGMPGLAYTYTRFLPRVLTAIGPAGVEQLTASNPAAWLTWHAPVTP